MPYDSTHKWLKCHMPDTEQFRVAKAGNYFTTSKTSWLPGRILLVHKGSFDIGFMWKSSLVLAWQHFENLTSSKTWEDSSFCDKLDLLTTLDISRTRTPSWIWYPKVTAWATFWMIITVEKLSPFILTWMPSPLSSSFWKRSMPPWNIKHISQNDGVLLDRDLLLVSDHSGASK